MTMDSKKAPVSRDEAGRPAASAKSEIDTFLERARTLAPTGEGRGRLIFALDATMSRQPTWDTACKLQAEMFAEAGKIGGLGIEQASQVVLYDDGNAKDAARVWWILRYFGLKDARLLNGGWSAWRKAGLPESTASAAVKARDFVIVTPNDGRLATKERILRVLKDGQKVQIIDTRSEAEHCGIDKFAKRGGAIPESLHLEWSEALDPGTHRFKSAAELAEIFKKAGVDLKRPSITYCQSGGRAAVMAFTLELMGAREVANYYRSWAEWGNADDTPVERPSKK